jgi:hypothetical protein
MELKVEAGGLVDDEAIDHISMLSLGNLHALSSDIVHQGWLMKQGHNFKTWKRRWCVVSSVKGRYFLHYYSSDQV